MKIYKYIHSCILLEEQGRGLLFDPGIFTFMDGHVKAEKFVDLDAIVITHNHSDHLDVEALKIIVGNNPGVQIFTNHQIVEDLRQAGIAATLLEEGSAIAGVFTVEAVPAPHERTLLADVFPSHAAYRVNGRVIHPGDSLSLETMSLWRGTEVLLFVASAPWMNERQAFDFVTAMQPKIAIPLHDGYIKEFFAKLRQENYANFFGRQGIVLIPMTEVGQSYDLAHND
jgi:L-ascorbate metabolism protein UlaG (beta-lactamase superfamily)